MLQRRQFLSLASFLGSASLMSAIGLAGCSNEKAGTLKLAFVPKALAIVVCLVFFGPWMLNTLVAYAAGIFNSLPSAAR